MSAAVTLRPVVTGGDSLTIALVLSNRASPRAGITAAVGPLGVQFQFRIASLLTLGGWASPTQIGVPPAAVFKYNSPIKPSKERDVDKRGRDRCDILSDTIPALRALAKIPLWCYRLFIPPVFRTIALPSERTLASGSGDNAAIPKG